MDYFKLSTLSAQSGVFGVKVRFLERLGKLGYLGRECRKTLIVLWMFIKNFKSKVFAQDIFRHTGLQTYTCSLAQPYVVTAPSGRIAIDTEQYVNDMDCSWLITAEEGKVGVSCHRKFSKMILNQGTRTFTKYMGTSRTLDSSTCSDPVQGKNQRWDQPDVKC